jgi:tryptophan halogenase
VYCNRFIGDDEAASHLLKWLDGRALGEPRVLGFTAGKRKRAWNRNVVALGLASGFMEPLESTSLLLVQTGILRLLDMFPDRGFDPLLAERYNRATDFESERIRDFLVLHYKATERDDSPFWNHCREMEIPPALQENIDLFRSSARFQRNGDEFFALPSWAQVMLGQRIEPQAYHPLVDQMPEKESFEFVEHIRKVIASCVQAMPPHQAFIDRYCKAPAA